ncbi:MAG: ABC transporter ATP-binding protein [bacterium]
MLRIRNLVTYYGKVKVLHSVSLHVDEGEIVTLIGANGAGKTTILNTISGMVSPKEGEISFLGERIDGLPPERIVRRGISQVPEGRQVFGSLNVLDNLRLGAYQRYRRGQKREIEESLEDMFELFPVLRDRARQLAGTLSGGEQQMLAIARALMAKPKLLLLDEPSLGLAPMVVRDIFERIVSLRRAGTTVLLVEQNARLALKIADRGYVIENGRIALEETSSELLENEDVRRAYLGRDYEEVWERK